MKYFLITLLFLFPIYARATTLTYSNTYGPTDTVTNVKLNKTQSETAAIVNGKLDNTNADTTSGFRFYQTVSVLPSAGSQGAVYFLTSDNSLNFDNGSSFSKVATNGLLMPTGAVFFMITGSCPAGSTDVSATYANKFLKVNATAGTSSGVVLTGTTDSHVLDITEIPAHTHTVATNVSGSSFGSNTIANSNTASDTNRTTSSAGGGLGHTHTISSATTLEPSSITAKLCQVN